MRNYQEARELFDLLNSNGVRYVVLRNFENLLSPELYVNGHGDIDLLCDDSQIVVDILDAATDRRDVDPFKGDGIHYYILINGKRASLDLRYVGDGYYCKKWEEDILASRVESDCFFVPNEQNYFYSLIYHSILQKRSFSRDYRERLKKMANKLGLTVEGGEREFLSILESYMQKRGYQFTWSSDYLVPNRFGLVDRKMVVKNPKLQMSHFLFDSKVWFIEFLVRIKHLIIR